jgi:hypothetical protein
MFLQLLDICKYKNIKWVTTLLKNVRSHLISIIYSPSIQNARPLVKRHLEADFHQPHDFCFQEEDLIYTSAGLTINITGN